MMFGALDLQTLLFLLEQEKSMRRHRVFVVFAAVCGGISHDFIAAYSTRARAQRFIDAQDANLRDCLSISEIELNRHTEDDYWRRPPDG